MDNQSPPPAPDANAMPPAMPNGQGLLQQITEKVKEANNVLVTVSANPSVDQLAAAIGLALLLNKLNKHGTAVFSGNVPSTIQFLKPEKTLEKNTDSLRDFIIALDKAKADKLRYKVEDEHVKIFITPYRTSINQTDLQFSQGDFNVDVVIALGVHEQKDLDQAITAHGRILHDATVASINNHPGANLGSINWTDEHASSLCEMVASLAEQIQANVFDSQMATAFLTGIVAETERFSNEKTGPSTMAVSGKLLAAGANQQLVAEQLEPPAAPQPAPFQMTPMAVDSDVPPVGSSDPNEPPKSEDGALLISHTPEPEAPPEEAEPELGQIHIDETGEMRPMEEVSAFVPKEEAEPASNMIMEPPTMGGSLSAATGPGGGGEPTSEGLSLPPLGGLVGQGAADAAPEPAAPEMAPAEQLPADQAPMEQAPPAEAMPAPEMPEAPSLPPAQPQLEAPIIDSQTLAALEQTAADDSHMQPEPQVVAPQPADLTPPPAVDTAQTMASDGAAAEPNDYHLGGVSGHKRIEPLHTTLPSLSLPPDPILGDTSSMMPAVDPSAMPLGQSVPPPAPPPMMPGLPPAPGASQTPPPMSGQVIPPQV